MSQFTFKMPDLGEGTVDAEIVAWHTKPGDVVHEDQLIVEVMTDKAAVEVPAPVSGQVISVTGAPGDKVAVGSPLIVFELNDGAAASVEDAPPKAVATPADSASIAPPSAAPERVSRVMTSPANRRRASEAGIDLATVAGSGPGGRILRADLDSRAMDLRAGDSGTGDSRAGPATAAAGGHSRSLRSPSSQAAEGLTEIKVIGLRRLIAERMSEAKRSIPHFAYVEEVDVTELESLRAHLNVSRPPGAGSLSYLPLVVIALTRVLESFPQCNVLYDAARGVLVRHRDMHVGIATQTPEGLKVPVVRNAQSLALWDLAAEIRRLAERARTNKSSREELSGSTITVTSLGKLGGIASTPIINAPEVAIIGLNKAVERPMVHQGAIAVRRMMNISSSFDHRFVDGYDAAAMIQALKERLEHPATLFIPTVKS